MPTPLPPSVGPYRLLRVVAQGARGTVCEASHPEFAQNLALRLLDADSAPGPGDAQAMRSACDAAARLQHPNIVALHDAGWHDGTAFVATEFVECETLAQYLDRVGRLPMLQAVALATQLLSALECAHRQGQVHTAIHPGNLLVCRTGQLRVAGFGWIAALRAVRSGRFDAPAYRAPEQARRRDAGDPRTDLYSAAVVAHQLLAGSLPPAADALPAPVAAVFERALDAEPGERYPSAGALSRALQSAVGSPVWDRSAPRRAAPIQVTPAPAPTLAPVRPAPATALVARSARLPQVAGRLRRIRPAAAALAAGCAAAVLLVASLLARAPAPAVAMPATTTQVPEEGPAVAVPQARADARPAAVPAPASFVAPAPVPVRSETVTLSAPPRNATPPPVETSAAPSPRPVAERAPAPRRDATATPRPGARPDGPRPALAAKKAPSKRNARAAQYARADLGCRQELAIAQEICVAVRCVSPKRQRHPVCMRLAAERRALDAQREMLGSS